MGWHLASVLARAEALHRRGRAVVCRDDVLSYGELAAQARELSAELARSGAGTGDRVAILHRNCHRFLIAALGTAWGGQVLVPLNLRLDAATLGFMLRDAGARLVLHEPATEALALQAAEAAGGLPVRDLAAGARTAHVPAMAAPGGDVVAGAAATAQIYYTSGTTGAPRGVMLTHGNIATHALMTVAELGLTDGDVWAHVAPMFHLADAWAVFAMTWVGGTHVMFPELEPHVVLQGFARSSVTTTNLVPTMLHRLVSDPSIESLRFPALRRVMSGGAPIAPTLVRRVRQAFRTEYVQTYGLTETSPYLTFSLPRAGAAALSEDEMLQAACRTGRPAIGVDLRVVDDGGADVPRDDRTVGEIRVRAPWVTPGYWQRPAETAAAFAGGWFLTGDLATIDADGSINIVDRRKDVIVTGGEKVYSVEVEQALLAHPAIDECAVVGAPDEEWGERVCAVVVPRGGLAVEPEEVRRFLKARLASFKVPKQVVVRDGLPKTGSGKIRKAEIRSDVAGSGR